MRGIRTVLLCALCCAVALPATASAMVRSAGTHKAAGGKRWVVKGAGFGHGVGMSQYGAYGYAKHGFTYDAILAHYYRGTTLGQAPTKTIRVLIRSGGSFSVAHVGRAGTRKLRANASYAVRASGSRVVLSGGGRRYRFSSPVRLHGPGGYTQLGTSWRGAMELRSNGRGGVIAVNVLPLDSYVQGVVPGEMPSSWMPEALKVQAVAARSYALATDAGGPLFDQYADTRSQAYHGMSAETPSTNAAVAATAGQVVESGGAIATTFYFSTSGGRTENVENVFYGSAPSPYLRSVRDPYDGGSPRHRWQFRYSRSALSARFGSLCRGRFKSLKIVSHGVSPRIVAADVVCTGGRVRTTGSALRARLGLYDNWFRIVRASSSAGRGKEAFDVPAVGELVRPRVVHGSFSPRPRQVDVYRLSDGHWRLVSHGLTNHAGQYSVPVDSPGEYRVSAGGVSAAPVVVR